MCIRDSSITGQLVNDFLPILEPIEENIRDNVMGASVQGKNNTWTQLRVKLFEDDERIRLRFIASGNTRSRTVSRKGFVRFFSNGNSNFLAGKELQVSRQGIFAHDATASANGRTKVVDLETDYDHIPLVGWVMRQMAMEELHEQRNTMKSVMTNRVSKAARTRLDESLQERITDYEGRLNEKIMAPYTCNPERRLGKCEPMQPLCKNAWLMEVQSTRIILLAWHCACTYK